MQKLTNQQTTAMAMDDLFLFSGFYILFRINWYFIGVSTAEIEATLSLDSVIFSFTLIVDLQLIFPQVKSDGIFL